MNFVDTQLGKLLENVKLAYITGFPIVYIPTDQQELVECLLTDEKCIHQIIPGVFSPENVKDAYVISSTPINYRVGKDFSFDKYPELRVFFGHSWKEDGIPTNSTKIIGGRRLVNKDGFIDKKKRANASKSLLIVVTPTKESIPAQYAPYVRVVEVSNLSDLEIIETIITPFFVSHDIPSQFVSISYLDDLSKNFRGFSRPKINSMLTQMWTDGLFDSFDLVSIEGNKTRITSIINQAKKELMSGCIGLLWESVPEQVKVGGMENAVKWIEQRKPLLKDIERSINNGHDIPKGILLSGIPGSGKSLLAKQTAITLGMPLISLNMGSVLGGVVGESEHNMDNALRIAERMAPCVLWIDEIEKAFSGSQSSGNDSGVAQRLFGKFLTWLQEKSAACFVFATANNITGLPPEFFRSERFDKKFYTFLPSATECADIIVSYINKENNAHREKRNRLSFRGEQSALSNEPELLFEKSLTDKGFWINLLNDNAEKEIKLTLQPQSDKTKHGKQTWLWKDDKRPKTKMFTGADLVSLLKEAKFLVRSRNHELDDYTLSLQRKSCRFSQDDFKKAFLDLCKGENGVQEFLSYGETNLVDIVDCFITLSENQFSPASSQEILNFNNFDLQEYVYSNGQHTALENAYDETMYLTLVGAINLYTKDIMNERKKQ